MFNMFYILRATIPSLISALVVYVCFPPPLCVGVCTSVYPHVELYSSQVVVKEDSQSQEEEVVFVMLFLSSSSIQPHVPRGLTNTFTHTSANPQFIVAVEHLSGSTAACKLCL